jgi:acyl-CoA synthetase (AMP-forming)/AMP-acid ligase II
MPNPRGCRPRTRRWHSRPSSTAVVGAPDPEWGKVVVVFVVLQPGADSNVATAAIEAALDAHCLAHIARFRRPKRYVFVVQIEAVIIGIERNHAC